MGQCGFAPRRGVAAAAVVSVLVTLSGCGGHQDPLSGPDATPAARRGVVTPVDVCGLVSAGTASQLLERALLVVGRTVGPSRDATVECQIGERFGEPLVTVTLAPAPVALDVFDAAYGSRAGGNPTAVKNLGQAAYARSEGTHRRMHVLVHGAVLSVGVQLEPTGSEGQVTMTQLIRMTRAAVDAMPDNPTVEPTTAPKQCNEINTDVLVNTLGRPPTLDAGLVFASGDLVCGWGGQPGSVTMSMTDDAGPIGRLREEATESDYLPVSGVLPGKDGTAFSSPESAGDLVVFVGTAQMLTLEVIPAAGYADTSIDTSASERAVAKAGLALLADLGKRS